MIKRKKTLVSAAGAFALAATLAIAPKSAAAQSAVVVKVFKDPQACQVEVDALRTTAKRFADAAPKVMGFAKVAEDACATTDYDVAGVALAKGYLWLFTRTDEIATTQP